MRIHEIASCSSDQAASVARPLCPATADKADTREAEKHHRPGRRLGNDRNEVLKSGKRKLFVGREPELGVAIGAVKRRQAAVEGRERIAASKRIVRGDDVAVGGIEGKPTPVEDSVRSAAVIGVWLITVNKLFAKSRQTNWSTGPKGVSRTRKLTSRPFDVGVEFEKATS